MGKNLTMPKITTGFNERRCKVHSLICEYCGNEFKGKKGRRFCSSKCIGDKRKDIKSDLDVYRGFEIKKVFLKNCYVYQFSAMQVVSLKVAKKCIDVYLNRVKLNLKQ